jgi:hypothetical protein
MQYRIINNSRYYKIQRSKNNLKWKDVTVGDWRDSDLALKDKVVNGCLFTSLTDVTYVYDWLLDEARYLKSKDDWKVFRISKDI